MKIAAPLAVAGLLALPLLAPAWARATAASPSARTATRAALAAAIPAAGTEDRAAPVIVVVVRHAEALPGSATEPDPALTEAGRARAEILARLLGHAGVTHLYATDLRRTRETLAPLAETSGVAIQAVSARAPERQIELLRALPSGAVAVVAGHSNTVPALVAALGGEARELVVDPRHGPMLAHDSHDRAFVVVRGAEPEPTVSTLELRFGE